MRLLSRATAALDRGVVHLMERRMATGVPSLATQPGLADARAQLVDLGRAYNEATLALPSPFFPVPEPIVPARTPQGEGPLGTQVVDLAWASGYVPFLRAAREPYLAHRENATAHVRWWTSPRGDEAVERPTAVLIHGWAGGAHWLTARAFDVAYWLRHGYDVAAFVLPFHGLRAPRGRSGALFPSTNPLRTNEAFGQAIYDLRALATWLRGRGSPAVGVIGMSLGGYTAALWASVDPELAFAVGLIPAVSFSRLMWRHGEHSAVRRRAAQAGITEDLLADAFAVHAPTSRPAQLPSDRLFVVAGRGDQITPPDQAEALAAHWGVEILWFDGGHLAQVGRGEAMRVVRRRLGALDLPGRTFRAP